MSDVLNELETLAGGKEITVSRIVAQAATDPAQPSKPSLITETVFVRKAKIRTLGSLAPAIEGGEVKQVEYYTGKDTAWVESLTDDSFEAVLEEGQRLNFPSFGRWLKRQGAVVEATTQNKVIHDLVQQAIREISTKMSDKLGASPKPSNS